MPRFQPRMRHVGAGMLALLAAGCAPVAVAPSPAPTSTLIPATAAPTVTPLPPTPLPTPTLSVTDAGILASSLLDVTPTPTPASDSILGDLNPIAAELVGIAQRLTAEQLDLPVRRVRLVSIQPFRWTDSSLGCPLPDQSYQPVESDGYRIVLAAGDDAFTFHTDFDRVLPCPLGFERLPEGTLVPTPPPEPTVPQVG